MNFADTEIVSLAGTVLATVAGTLDGVRELEMLIDELREARGFRTFATTAKEIVSTVEADFEATDDTRQLAEAVGRYRTRFATA